MKFKPTKFDTTIAGQTYVFALLSMREMERLAAKEAAAAEAKDLEALRDARREIVAACMTRGGSKVTIADIADMDQAVYATLFHQMLEAHGQKLDAKMSESSGEVKASATS